MKPSLTKPTVSQLLNKLGTIFPFVCVILVRVVGGVQHLGNETDHTALLAIRSQLVDRPGGIFSSWNHSLHHCDWDGVICGRKHNRVVELDLSSRSLVGNISPFVGNMSFLKVIALYNNTLFGQIPSELGRLIKLKELGLFNNTLDGNIPANLSSCVKLEILSFGINKLTGKLPVEFRAFSKLKALAVHLNNLTGPIWEVISNITSLEIISVGYNAFTGSIPSSIGKMSNLNSLYGGGNEFSGTLSLSILNCSMLKTLALGGNNLHGNVPRNIGLKLPHLTWLDLSVNHFLGVFPISILNITSIQLIALGSNRFIGTIPFDFGRLFNLWFIDLGDNHFEGDINFIHSLTNCSKLEILGLDFNKFKQTLPKSIANFSKSLRVFTARNNRIKGTIPIGIINLINLQFISLANNQLIGSIPHEIGKLQSLEKLYLNSNKLEGSIPDLFGNLSRLSIANLSNNQLQGTIPPSLGSCQSLLNLDLSSNHLNGTLGGGLFKGVPMFISLSLHDNLIEGSVPQEISMQVNLENLSLSKNKLSGTIPDGLGQCRGLISLAMHDNFLTGHIPPSLASLGSLQIVDLSRNNLSGIIPSYFSIFPLQLLNLSYNNFEGRVPTNGVFANFSAIELDGNIKLCGGVPKLHLASCVLPTKKRKTRKLSHALKLTIPILCIFVGVLVVAILLYLTYRKRRRVDTSTGSKTGSTTESFIKVSYNNLLTATNGFSAENLVGAGNFGSVFKGNLGEKVVAIKVLNLQTRGASKSFIAECNVLRNARHRNLVGIITVCSSIDFQRNNFRALVFEFMPNGNLDGWLHGDGTEKLNLVQRVDIAIDVAQALNYLHHDCETPIVHCDLKPSNVLLDDDMVAHVGDFGLAKFIAQPRHPNQSSSIGILGTIGYVAPEYGLGSESSPDGDLYSYGILVLELVTGKRPTDKMFHEGYNLQLYAEEALPDNMVHIVDPTLLEDNEINEEVDDIRTIESMVQRKADCIISMIGVGIACSKHVPQDRMKIGEAISKLRVARDHLGNARQRCDFTRDA